MKRLVTRSAWWQQGPTRIVLRQLGAPPSWSLDETLAEVLGPLHAAAGALAGELAFKPSEEVAPLPEAPDRTEKVIRTNLTGLARIQTAVRRIARTRDLEQKVQRASRGRRFSKSREGTRP